MTKVAVAIIKQTNHMFQDEYLLIQSTKDFGVYTGFWYPPGGHVEENENEEETLIRELKEELNLKIKPLEKIAETEGDIKDQITDWWKCEIVSGEIKLQKEEITDAEYFTKNDMSVIYLWPATKKFFEEYIFKGIIK